MTFWKYLSELPERFVDKALTVSGRKGIALIALLGGCVTFALFAAIGVYLVKGDVEKSFWLAVIAHIQILVGLSTLGALLVRRSFKITKEGVEITDHEVRSDIKIKIEQELN